MLNLIEMGAFTDIYIVLDAVYAMRRYMVFQDTLDAFREALKNS